MFPCNQEMVLELEQSLDSAPQSIAPLCRTIRNACVGSPKRKERFASFGLVPVLFRVVQQHPDFARDALLTLGSLAQFESTSNQVLEASENQHQLWHYILTPKALETAEAAAKILRILVSKKPNVVIEAFQSDREMLAILQSDVEIISKLGARCILASCETSGNGLGFSLAGSEEALSILRANRYRSEDDALALAMLTWKRTVVRDRSVASSLDQETENVNIKKQRLNTGLLKTSPSVNNPHSTLAELWAVALDVDVRVLPQSTVEPELPKPGDGRRLRSDGESLLMWCLAVLNRLDELDDDGSCRRFSTPTGSQKECQAVLKRLRKQVIESSTASSLALKRESAAALAVFGLSRPHRAVLASFAAPFLVHFLNDDDDKFALAGLLALTYTRDGSTASASVESFQRFSATRACLSEFIGDSSTGKARLPLLLKHEDQTIAAGAIRLVRHFSTCEESTVQLVELDVHSSLADAAIAGNRDAVAALVNITSMSETVVSYLCGMDASFWRWITSRTTHAKDDLAWALLTNLCATGSIENKRKIVSQLPLARLVSDRGLAVLRNLCVTDAELIEPVLQPTLTLIASGLDPGASLDQPLAFLVNIASLTETHKAAVCNDARLLQMLLNVLESHDSSTSDRFSALRCLMNVLLPASSSLEGIDAQQQQQATSPRSPMLRIVHARVMAAASRSPLRFGGSSSSTVTSPAASGMTAASRQAKLIAFGFPRVLHRIVETVEDEAVKDLAGEVIHCLSGTSPT